MLNQGINRAVFLSEALGINLQICIQPPSGCWSNSVFFCCRTKVPVSLMVVSQGPARGCQHSLSCFPLALFSPLTLSPTPLPTPTPTNSSKSSPSHILNLFNFSFFHISLPPAREDSMFLKAHVIRLSYLNNPQYSPYIKDLKLKYICKVPFVG